MLDNSALLFIKECEKVSGWRCIGWVDVILGLEQGKRLFTAYKDEVIIVITPIGYHSFYAPLVCLQRPKDTAISEVLLDSVPSEYNLVGWTDSIHGHTLWLRSDYGTAQDEFGY